MPKAEQVAKNTAEFVYILSNNAAAPLANKQG
jgi:hypothetical protein